MWPVETTRLIGPGARLLSSHPRSPLEKPRTPSRGMHNSTLFMATPGPPDRTPRRFSEPALRPLWMAASFAVLLYVCWMLLAGLFQPRLDWLAGTTFASRLLLYYLCLNGFVLALSAACLCLLDGESFRALGLWFHSNWFLQGLAGLAWGSGVISLTALALFLSRAVAVPPVSFRPSAHLVLLLAFLFLAATFEELTFRGYALQRLAVGLGPVAAACVSSALFGFAHSGNPQATLLSTLNTMLAGIFLAAARLRSRALWMPIGLHFGWNLFLGPVFSFPVSGYAFGAKELAAHAVVPLWLTGGAYGPEGSAALTAILVAAILLLLRLPLPVASLGPQSEVD